MSVCLSVYLSHDHNISFSLEIYDMIIDDLSTTKVIGFFLTQTKPPPS
ncbi:hypothetical protein DFA_06785 [Cavenderia fasciculata]|uniref:Uncharacterized protein n=1 Tax=Cavenderia fasciculata TaxID=261658 RepID=F4Q298_CACFS|nr:uncharacterized protein DFA_06785 [Cavenderia fasciculata]EGG18118.1 hypothetical protein DFA_06785 [Cavenderia fasciculata]|eukprot:XP_004366159.1 hypothetical protein DFA_06785 [Cavenderia fasciculata]